MKHGTLYNTFENLDLFVILVDKIEHLVLASNFMTDIKKRDRTGLSYNFSINDNGFIFYEFYGDRPTRVYKFDSDGFLHNDNGPARVGFMYSHARQLDTNDTEFKCEVDEAYYYIHGVLHRMDGPAIEHPLYIQWWVNGVLHRMDGPAHISDENVAWYKKGKLHRVDGPANIGLCGSKNNRFLQIKKTLKDVPKCFISDCDYHYRGQHVSKEFFDYINDAGWNPNRLTKWQKQTLCLLFNIKLK